MTRIVVVTANTPFVLVQRPAPTYRLPALGADLPTQGAILRPRKRISKISTYNSDPKSQILFLSFHCDFLYMHGGVRGGERGGIG